MAFPLQFIHRPISRLCKLVLITLTPTNIFNINKKWKSILGKLVNVTNLCVISMVLFLQQFTRPNLLLILTFLDFWFYIPFAFSWLGVFNCWMSKLARRLWTSLSITMLYCCYCALTLPSRHGFSWRCLRSSMLTSDNRHRIALC